MRVFDISAIISTQCSTINVGKPPSLTWIKEKSKTIHKKKELITDAWIVEHNKWLRYIGRRVYLKKDHPQTRKKIGGQTRKDYKLYPLRVQKMMRRAKELAWYQWQDELFASPKPIPNKKDSLEETVVDNDQFMRDVLAFADDENKKYEPERITTLSSNFIVQDCCGHSYCNALWGKMNYARHHFSCEYA